MPETFKGFNVPATEAPYRDEEETPVIRPTTFAEMTHECCVVDCGMMCCSRCLFDSCNPEAVAAYKEWHAQFYTEAPDA